jgi:hypothetical protein
MKETTAQDASGSTIGRMGRPAGRRVVQCWRDRASCGTSQIGIRCVVDTTQHGEEAVDAAGPVDAQNAPTGPWKTADGFPRAPTAIIVSLIKGESQRRHQTRPATSRRQ